MEVLANINMSDTGDISVNGTVTSNNLNLTSSGYSLAESGASVQTQIYQNSIKYDGINAIFINETTVNNFMVNKSFGGLSTSGTAVFYYKANSIASSGCEFVLINSSSYDSNVKFSLGTRSSSSSSNFSGYNFAHGAGYATNLTFDTNWHKFLITWNSSIIKVYENNFSKTIYQNSTGNFADDFYGYGFRSASTNNYCYFDNIYICNGIEDCSSNVSNFSVTGYNYWNSSVLDYFNLTMTNGITIYDFNTSTGSITTQLLTNDTSLWNLTYWYQGKYFNVTYNNVNLTSNFHQGYLYQSIMNISNINGFNVSVSLNNSNVCDLTSYSSCLVYPNEGSYVLNASSTTTGVYPINKNIIVDALDNETYFINMYSFSSPTGYFGETSNIVLNLSKTTNQSYSSAKLIYDGTVYDSPTQTDYTNYTLFTQSISNTAIGNFSYYWNVSLTDYGNQFNFSTITSSHLVIPNLIINFKTMNGSTTNTSGEIIYEEPFRIVGFANMSILNLSVNTSTKTTILYNAIPSNMSGILTITNWTQYYESTFENELYELNLTIIPTNNLWYGYILVKDSANTPISEAIIEARHIIAQYQTLGYTGLFPSQTSTILGKRFTGDDGYTFFIADKNSQVLFSISKEGYETEERLITIGDNDYTQDNPIRIILTQGTTNMIKNVWGYIPNQIRNISNNLEGTIVAYDYDQVEITTDYRTRMGYSQRDITCVESTNNDNIGANCFRGRNNFTLESCVDFNCTAGNTDDIILSIYADNEFITNWTINAYYANVTDIIPVEEIADVRTKIAAILQAIALLLAIIMMNLIFKGSPSVGINTFFTGIIILSIINPTYYLWLGFIGAAYFGFKLIKTLIDE